MVPVGFWRTAPVELSLHAMRMGWSRVYEEMNVDEISGKIDVSNNAIYQQLRRVWKVLPEIVRNLEP
jgi:hypothetical protein